MKFKGTSLIEIEIDAPSKAVAEQKFKDDMRISSYTGIRRTVLLEPNMEEIDAGDE